MWPWPQFQKHSFSSHRTSPYARPQSRVFGSHIPNISNPSSSFNSGNFGSAGFPVTLRRNPTQSTRADLASWNPACPMDLHVASQQTSLATGTIREPNQISSGVYQATATNNPVKPAVLRLNGPRNLGKMKNEGGVFVSQGNTVTFPQTKSQGPKQGAKKVPPPPQKKKPFMGLSTTVNEGSFTVIITDTLMDNYRKCRMAVVNEEGILTTPLRYINKLCYEMEINCHMEEFIFRNNGPTQFRTEIYVGGFCGVAHALSRGFSKQLAAAHCLERMRIHFRSIKQLSYGLFPGATYTRIGPKLEELCLVERLGGGEMVVKNRRDEDHEGQGDSNGGREGSRFKEVKWECSCFVEGFSQETVLSDHLGFGIFEAKARMYLKIVEALEVPKVQIKDYFAIGVDCPMLKDIHPSIMLNLPSNEKFAWMHEYGVPHTQIDNVLHEPTNQSSYLSEGKMRNKLVRFGEILNVALKGIREESLRRSLGMATPRQGQNKVWEMDRSMNGRRDQDVVALEIRGWEMGGLGLMNGVRGDAVAMETREMDGENDEEDCEVEEIFFDAMEF